MTYVAIEGVIGVGKTTLARLLAPELDAQLVLEVFEENPFLSNFYADRARYAFQTQIFFLLSRYHQQRSERMTVRPLISDYIFSKDALFARLNLSGDELEMYARVHEALAERIARPDLVVFLRADTDVLMQRITQRDRPYERNMARDYIDSLRRAYDAFFADYQDTRVLTVEANRLDFVASADDREEVIAQVMAALGRAPHQESLPGFNGGRTVPGGETAVPVPAEALTQPAEAPAQPAAESPALAPDLDQGARRLGDFQQFHDWLDTAKAFDRDPLLNFVLLQEEVGEVARLLSQRHGAKRDQGQSPATEAIGAELADVLAYLLKLANYLDVDLETAYLDKMRVNRDRDWKK